MSPLTVWRRLALWSGYAGGSFGVNLAMWPRSALLMYFLTETAGFSVALATFVITAPKFWDVLADPAVAMFASRLSLKHGSRARALLLGGVVVCSSAVLVYWLPAGAPAWYSIPLILLQAAESSAFMAFFVSHLALADDIDATGAERRDSLLAWRVGGQAAGGLTAAALGPLLIVAYGGGQPGYFGMACTLALIALLSILPLIAHAHRIPCSVQSEQRAAQGVLHVLKEILPHRAVLALVFAYFMVCVASGVTGTFLPYANKVFFAASDAGMSIFYSAIMAGMLAGSFLAGAATRHVARFKALLSSTLLMLLAACLFSGIGGSRSVDTAVFLLWGTGLGAYALLAFSTMMDLAAEIRPDMAGLLLGVMVSTGKIGDSVGGAVVGLMLGVTDYLPGQPATAAVTAELKLAFALVTIGAMAAALVSLKTATSWFLGRST